VPIFLDRHDLSGLTAADIAEAHRKDLEVQGQYGVRFLHIGLMNRAVRASVSLMRQMSRLRCGFITKLTATWPKM
jgi:hypothetical protein